MNKYIFDKSNGKLLFGGPYEPIFDSSVQDVIETGERHPDPRTERVNVATKTLRPATTAEIAIWDNEQKDAQAKAEVDARFMRALVLTLLDVIDARHPATLVDRAAFRQAAIDKYKTL